MDVPGTQYAKTPDGVHIAYQVSGQGPIDLMYTSGYVFPAEACWEDPTYRRFLERLGSFSRVIMFDRRGTGLSDPVSPSDPPTMEQWADDALAVLDAVGSPRAAVFGWANIGGPAAILFAATHPDRTSALILANTLAKGSPSPDYPFGTVLGALQGTEGADIEQRIQSGWGTVEGLPVPVRNDPSIDKDVLDWLARSYRRGASPSMAVTITRISRAMDVRPALSLITVPTLVVHQAAPFRQREHSVYLAEHIPGARLVDLEGGKSFVWQGDTRRLLDEVEEFLTGARSDPEPDRVLATVLFSDIVASTQRATELGDRRWKELLQTHDDVARRQLTRFRGREVKTTGDGILATFDGPARAVNCACALRDAMSRSLGIEMRCGLHTGEIELRGDDISGIAVHIGQRVSALAGSGEILVSRTVTDLVAGSGIEFVERGEHELKGVAGRWQLYAVRA